VGKRKGQDHITISTWQQDGSGGRDGVKSSTASPLHESEMLDQLRNFVKAVFGI